MNFKELDALVKSHTWYDIQCECGEFLGKKNGPVSFRAQWEDHFTQILNLAFNGKDAYDERCDFDCSYCHAEDDYDL